MCNVYKVKLFLIIITMLLIGIINVTYADNMQTVFNQTIQQSQSLKNTAYDNLKNFNPNATFKNYSAHPQQTKYYSDVTQANDARLKQDALSSSTTNIAGNAITQSIKQRPQYSINQNVLSSQSQQIAAQYSNEQAYCIDGNCTDHSYQPSQDFASSVSSLSGINDASKDLSPQANFIFRGKILECRDDAVNFSNCCKDNGWGQDIHLAHCNREERALGEARKHKVTVYVGRYCAKHLPWPANNVCIEHKQTYCAFDSKLARIIQQQGREQQLGIDFGDAKQPDCSGITPYELQRINLEKIDFQEFYADLDQKRKIPDLIQIQNIVKQHIQQNIQHAKTAKSAGQLQ